MKNALRGAVLLALSGWLVPAANSATIVEAVSTNDRASVAKALADGADPNESYGGATGLHLAAEWGYGEIVELLLRNGAKVDAVDRLGKTPLLWAVANGHEEIARLLLAAKADPNWHDPSGNSVISEAAAGNQLSLVRFLLNDAGAKVFRDDVLPLRAAINNRNGEMVRLFLEAGVNPCGKPERGIGPFYAAATYGSVEILKIMREHVHVCPDQAILFDGFAGAAEDGILPVVEYLLSLKPGRERIVRALKETFEDRKIEVAKFLIENAPDLTAEDKGSFLADAAERDGLPLFEFLIEHGAALSVRNASGRTPLVQACLDGDLGKAKFLIEHKAPLEASDSTRVTPLLAACQAGSAPIVELLLKQGASLRAVDENKRNAFLTAASRGKADVCIILAAHGADVNAADPATGATALHYAAELDDVVLAKALVSLGAKKAIKTRQGRTARDIAEEAGAIEIFDLLAPSPSEKQKTKGRR
jgi:ankyrin repeat protein